ncbi:RND family efflux transporter, MFP subunit [Rhodospirillaceae bacterium LM-1]|nr:RND family efflux transporter, MFP subunit [Rhodospirillaceae bacterium LM-1]
MPPDAFLRLAGAAVVLLAAATDVHAQAANERPQQDQVRVLLVPTTETTLASQIAAKIQSMSVSDGERFKQGQALVSMDCSIQQAQLQKSQSELKSAEMSLDSQRKLDALGAGSGLNLGLAEAAVTKSKAELALNSRMTDYCQIRAPFNGRVVQRRAQPFQNVTMGQPVLDILDDTSLRLELIVPSRWLVWLRIGQKFNVQIDETGNRYPARILKIAARVDAASQSIKVTGEISGHYPELLAGMSGIALLKGP